MDRREDFWQRLFGVFFLAVVGGLFLLALPGALEQKAAGGGAGWNGGAAYPFAQEAAAPAAEQTERLEPSLLDRVAEKAYALENRMLAKEDELSRLVKEDHPLYMRGVLLNRLWCRYVCGMNMTTALSGPSLAESQEVVVERSDGLLAYIMADEDVTPTVDALAAFAREMEAEGRYFLYFEAPIKSADVGPEYGGVVKDYTMARDRLANELLAERGVNYLSCYEAMETEGLTHADLFFKTDHHWLPQGGLWACRLLARALNEQAGFQADLSLLEEDSYDVQWLPEAFLGSQGRKVTEVYARPEDFPVLLPCYESDLTVFHSARNDTLTGTIADTMLDWSALAGEDLYSSNAYALYGYGDEGLTQIHNNALHDGRRVLFLKVSVGDCMAPYLSNVAEYVDLIDLRAFGGSLRTYLRETDPDAVVFIYGTSLFEAKNAAIFNFR